MVMFKVGDKVRITNGCIPGCPGHSLRVGSTATITSLPSDGLGAALSGIGDHGRPISQTLWFTQFEVVTAPKFKVGDKVRIVGPSQTGGDVRRGEVVTVSSVQTDHRGNTWYNVTVKPRCSLSTYAAASLEAVVEPPAVTAPYIVMLRGKDGRTPAQAEPVAVCECGKQYAKIDGVTYCPDCTTAMTGLTESELRQALADPVEAKEPWKPKPNEPLLVAAIAKQWCGDKWIIEIDGKAAWQGVDNQLIVNASQLRPLPVVQGEGVGK